jgi:uncharacterized protein
MKRRRAIPVLGVLLLSAVAVAGCTVNLNPPNVQLNPSRPPSEINLSGTNNGTAHMLAVEEQDNNQYSGAISDVVVYSQPGSGHVFVETSPLTGLDFQATARDAVKVAAEWAHVNQNQRDFEFVVQVPKGVDTVDGVSAGLPMAVAAYSAITKKPTNADVYGTGAIDSMGTVSSVSGVYLKSLAAAKSGARVIIVPSNEVVVSTTSLLATAGSVNLQAQLKKDGYNVTVVGVNSFEDALPYYFT